MGYEMNLSDRQWFNLLCGMNAGMMVKNRRAAFGRTAITTYVVGNPAAVLPDVVLGVEGLDCLSEDAYNTNTNYKVVTGLEGQSVTTEDFTQSGYMNHMYSDYPGFDIYGGGSVAETYDWLRWGVMLYFPRDVAVRELSFTIYVGSYDGSRIYPSQFGSSWQYEAEWNSNIAEYFDITWHPISSNIIGIEFKMTIREEGTALQFAQGKYELGVFKCGSFTSRVRGYFSQLVQWRQSVIPAFLELNDEILIEHRPDKVYWTNQAKDCGVRYALANYEECLVCDILQRKLVYEEGGEQEEWDPTQIAYTDIVVGKFVYTANDLRNMPTQITDELIAKYHGTYENLWVLRTQQGGWGTIDIEVDVESEGYAQTTLQPRAVELAEVDVTSAGAGSSYIDSLIEQGAITGTRPNLSWSSTEITPFAQAISRFGSVTYEGNLYVDRSCVVYVYIADEQGNQLSVSVPVSLAKGVNKVKIQIPLLADDDMVGELRVYSSLYYVVDDNGFGDKPEGTAALAGATVTTQGTASAPPFPVRPVGEDKITIKDVLNVEVYDIPVPSDEDIDETITVEDDIDVTEVTEFDGEVAVEDTATVNDDLSVTVRAEFNGTVNETVNIGMIDEADSSAN